MLSIGEITMLSSISSPFLVIVASISLGFVSSYVEQISSEKSDVVKLPTKFRTEGQIIWMLHREDQLIQHHLAFTESIDSMKLQSAISINYKAHKPNDYYKRANSPLINVQEDGLCYTKPDTMFFVPEISRFADIMLMGLRDEQYSSSHNIGPSGFLTRLLNLEKKVDTSKILRREYYTVHRYVNCLVKSTKFRLEAEKVDFEIEIYSPNSDVSWGNREERYFSIKATALFDKGRENSHGSNNATLILDYLLFHPIDLHGTSDSATENTFHLPLGRGCSAILNQITPNFGTRSSFSMDYDQKSSAESIELAYDQTSGLLQKNILASSTSIWLLNKNLLINLDKGLKDSPDKRQTLEWEPCALLNVSDNQQLAPAFQPNKQATSNEPLDVASFLGVSKISYMGRGSVRDLPCHIYETIVTEPPAIFAYAESQLTPASDYIVQIYLLQGADRDATLESGLQADDFKPSKLVLLRRSMDLATIVQVDELEVHDFSWSLDEKIDRLFRVQECFGRHAIESEQIQLELAISFCKLEDDDSISATWFQVLWPLNRRKLESEMLNDLLELLETDRLHMVDYDFDRRPQHLDVSMVLADWVSEPRKLKKVAEGGLSYEWITSDHEKLISYKQVSEARCLLIGSHIKSTSLVIYCREQSLDLKWNFQSVCGAVQGMELDFQIMKALETEVDPTFDGSHCRAYRFLNDEPGAQLGSVANAIENINLLHDYWFDFDARIPARGDPETWRARVRNFELRHDIKLETIDNLAFVVDDQQDNGVHAFDSIVYRTLGDCTKTCNLDATCRSYSFCLETDSFMENACIISALDVRASMVQEQLYAAQSSISEPITVEGLGPGDLYNLSYSKNCKIYERNYLDVFRDTEEIIRLKRSVANQYPKTATTFECAKLGLDSELHSNSKQVAMFAYCANDNLCILDEDLFIETDGDNKNSTTSTDQNTDPMDDILDEIACRVYRKRYQSFYQVSSHVLKQQSLEDGQQLEFTSHSLEDCARVCWNKFGEDCASFDYCEPGSCLINRVKSDMVESELKLSCLHYERNFKLDQLRREYSAVQNQILGLLVDKPDGWIFGLCSYFVALMCTLVGFCLTSRVLVGCSTKLSINSTASKRTRAGERDELIGGVVYEQEDMEMHDRNLQNKN